MGEMSTWARKMRQHGRPRPINLNRYERVASMVGGGMLAAFGLSRRSIPGLVVAAAGGALIYRGKTGHCPMYRRLGIDTTRESYERGITVRRAITIARPRAEVYGFWRHFDNLPRFLTHVKEVRYLGEGVSEWIVEEGPLTLRWQAELTADVRDQRLEWRSLPLQGRSDIEVEGKVEFRDAPGGRGTEVHVEMSYAPPGGRQAMMLAPFIRRISEGQLGQEMVHLKQILETGEIPTNARGKRDHALESLTEAEVRQLEHRPEEALQTEVRP